MFKEYATPLHLEPGFPRVIAAFLIAGYVTAGTAVMLAPVPLTATICGIVLLCLDGIRIARNHLGLCRARTIGTLVWNREMSWTLAPVSGKAQEVTLIPAWYQQPWLIILRFRCADGRRRCVLLSRDRLPAENFRRLHVRLRLAAALHGRGAWNTGDATPAKAMQEPATAATGLRATILRLAFNRRTGPTDGNGNRTKVSS